MEHLVSTALFWPIIWLVAGLVILLAGGHFLVPATVSLARHAKLPPQLVTLLLVAGGTSAPELLVSVDAAMSGSPAIAISNVVGSNIANIWLVLGLGALFAPLATSEPSLRRDILVMLFFTGFVLFFFLTFKALPLLAAAAMLAGFGAYVLWLLQSPDGAEPEQPDGQAVASGPLLSVISLMAAIAALVIGADLMVDGAVDLARLGGLSEAVIGLTIVAIGTSLPEIAAVLASLWHRQTDLALANVIGSNIFNLAAVLGLAGLLAPLPAAPDLIGFGLPSLAVASGILGLFILAKRPVGRASGLVFIGLYLMFLFWTFAR